MTLLQDIRQTSFRNEKEEEEEEDQEQEEEDIPSSLLLDESQRLMIRGHPSKNRYLLALNPRIDQFRFLQPSVFQLTQSDLEEARKAENSLSEFETIKTDDSDWSSIGSSDPDEMVIIEDNDEDEGELYIYHSIPNGYHRDEELIDWIVLPNDVHEKEDDFLCDCSFCIDN